MPSGKAPVSHVENSVLARSVIIACVILTTIFILLLFVQDNLTALLGRYADEDTVGMMLLALWLVVGSTVRSMNTLSGSLAAWKLLLGGVLVGGISGILTTAFLFLFPDIAKSQNMAEVTGAAGGLILILSLLAFVISMIVVVNIRVRNRSLGNLLEVLIIGGVIVGLVWYASR